MATFNMKCFKRGCTWTHTGELEDVTKAIPVGAGKLTLSVYQGEDKANDANVTLCPDHAKELWDSLNLNGERKQEVTP